MFSKRYYSKKYFAGRFFPKGELIDGLFIYGGSGFVTVTGSATVSFVSKSKGGNRKKPRRFIFPKYKPVEVYSYDASGLLFPNGEADVYFKKPSIFKTSSIVSVSFSGSAKTSRFSPIEKQRKIDEIEILLLIA